MGMDPIVAGIPLIRLTWATGQGNDVAVLLTHAIYAKRSACDLAAARPFAGMGSQITWPTANGHIVRPRGFGGPPG